MTIFIFPRPNLVKDALAAQGAVLLAVPLLVLNQALNRQATKASDAVVVDPALPFTPADIPNDWVAGNGTTMGQIKLGNGTLVLCCWIVIEPGAQAVLVSGNLAAVKAAFT